ncbi:unnamed protein product [Rotaria sp. Silwood1]|nr:unnamed protein product [Rotaria sp. Silwood1]CAF1684061.1 unnamed protein product [Rotaria sp. Silwood1]
MVIARFLMANVIDQLLEHQNQNANLFDFDQLLISIQIGSIEEIRVSEALKTVIVDSVQIEDDKWKRLSRQIVDLLLAHLQSQDQSLLDIYSTQLTLVDVVSSVELRSIDPFVIAFRALNDVLLSVNGTRDETFSEALLRILHDVILRILTNTRQLCGQFNMTLVSLASDYLYVLIDTCTYVHNLFDLIHHTSIASHLFVSEGMHLDGSGLLLVLLIEQFLPLPYISVLRLAELIVYDRIETILTLDPQTLNKQLLPKYTP